MSMFPQSTSKPVELEYGTVERTMFNFFNAVYAWMAVGLALTAAVAFGVSHSPTAMKMIYGNPLILAATSIGLFVIAIASQRAILRVSSTVGTAIFLLYAALMGVLISYIFVVYKLETIGAAFMVTGGVFAVMSVYGYITKRDLTSIGSLCVMGLIGLVIASVVNIFLASNALSWIVTYGVLAVTLGIIAYYTQALKEMADRAEGNPAMLSRIAIFGSLVLYISFINLFLSVLRIMNGKR